MAQIADDKIAWILKSWLLVQSANSPVYEYQTCPQIYLHVGMHIAIKNYRGQKVAQFRSRSLQSEKSECQRF